MGKKLIDFKECLFEAFIDNEMYNPQSKQRIWAIYEGLCRIDSAHTQWSVIDSARKSHDCIRGHLIKVGDTYFHYQVFGAWGSDWKLCAGCMAMILYFQEVDKLKPYMFTHWGIENNQPICVP